MKTAVNMIGKLSIGLSLSMALSAQTFNISTVTGSYSLTSTSTASPLNGPVAVAVDSAGVVYFTDTLGNRVRKYDPATGQVTTIAGDGTIGRAANGVGGPAVKGKLWQPKGLAFDTAGNMYISDAFNCTIEKVDTTGLMTTFAGVFGGCAFTGDGRPAITAYLRNPQRIKTDAAGNLYIAEAENNRVRKITTDGIIHTIAGSGGNNTSSGGGFVVAAQPGFPAVLGADGGPAVLSKLGQPQDIAVDQWGNVYIADTTNNRIRLVSKTDPFGNPLRDASGKLLTDSTAIITTVAGGGTGCGTSGVTTCAGNDQPLNATLLGPRGIALDSANNLYIADSGNNRILYLNFNLNAGCLINASCAVSSPTLTVVNTGPVTAGLNTAPLLSTPAGIALSGTNLYVAEETGNRIRVVDLTSQTSTILMQGGASPLTGPKGLAVDAAGNIWVSDAASNRVGKVSQTDGSFSKLAGTCPPRSNAGVQCPAVGALPGFPTTGGDIVGYLGLTAPVAAANSQVSAPWGGAFDSLGNFIFADRGNNRIRMITPQGNITTVAGGANSPNISTTAKLPTASTAGNYSGDGLPAVQATLRSPSAVAVDSLGQIYIADTGNNAIRKIDTNGIMSTFAGIAPTCATGNTTCAATAVGGTGDGLLATEANLNQPVGVAVDNRTGIVYIADTNNHAIRAVTPDGIISTPVGILTSEGIGADGIVGTLSSESSPVSVAVDSNGLVYFADGCNFVPAQVPAAVANANPNQFGQCRDSRIRMWNPTTSLMTTLTSGNNTAALGSGSLAGDGGASTKALALYPSFVTVDSQNNVYFTDITNRIRKLTPVTTK